MCVCVCVCLKECVFACSFTCTYKSHSLYMWQWGNTETFVWILSMQMSLWVIGKVECRITVGGTIPHILLPLQTTLSLTQRPCHSGRGKRLRAGAVWMEGGELTQQNPRVRNAVSLFFSLSYPFPASEFVSILSVYPPLSLSLSLSLSLFLCLSGSLSLFLAEY